MLSICPDLPAGLKNVHESRKLDFPLFSDTSVALSEQFGIAFHVDDATVDMYLTKYNIDLEKASGEKHHNLPVPAVFVIDAEGTIKFAYTNADHTTRLSNDELLEQAT